MTEMSNMSHDALLDHMQACEDLLNACGTGRFQQVEKALLNGANPNFLRTDQGALMIATRRDYKDIVLRLIEAGADVNQAMRNGWTPLLEAARQNLPHLMEPLIEAGANVDQWDGDGMTALYVAVRAKAKEATMYLISKKAAPDISTFAGVTPLMEAVKKEEDFLITQLIQAGADVLIKDKDGKTALDYAKESSWKLGITILEQAERLSRKNSTMLESTDGISLDKDSEEAENTGVSKIKKRKPALG